MPRESRAVLMPDEIEALRDAAATGVHGWHRARIPWAYSDEAECWHDADGNVMSTTYAWRPDEDDTQRAALVDAVVSRGWTLHMSTGPESTRAWLERDGHVTEAVEDGQRGVAVLKAVAILTRETA